MSELVGRPGLFVARLAAITSPLGQIGLYEVDAGLIEDLAFSRLYLAILEEPRHPDHGPVMYLTVRDPEAWREAEGPGPLGGVSRRTTSTWDHTSKELDLVFAASSVRGHPDALGATLPVQIGLALKGLGLFDSVSSDRTCYGRGYASALGFTLPPEEIEDIPVERFERNAVRTLATAREAWRAGDDCSCLLHPATADHPPEV